MVQTTAQIKSIEAQIAGFDPITQADTIAILSESIANLKATLPQPEALTACTTCNPKATCADCGQSVIDHGTYHLPKSGINYYPVGHPKYTGPD